VWRTYLITVPVWRTNDIRVLSQSEEQIFSLLSLCEQQQYISGCPSGNNESVRVRGCCPQVSSKILFDYYSCVYNTLCCLCANGEITFDINGTRSADCTNVSGFFCLRNTNVASFSVRVPAWKTGSCRDGDTKFYSRSSEIAYWRPLFCVICIFFKAWIVRYIKPDKDSPISAHQTPPFCPVVCHSTLYNLHVNSPYVI
jgi:hypothetical protein